MRPSRLFVMLTAVFFLLTLAGESQAAGFAIDVSPNPQGTFRPVNITVVVGVGDEVTMAQSCDIKADFGDGTVKMLGRCVVSSGACTIQTTHTYNKPGEFLIHASTTQCKYRGQAKKSVKIFPAKPLYPEKPRK